MRNIIIALTVLLAGCATAPIDQFTHADLQNAAKIATTNGYPARASVWIAYDQLLTASEQQVAACKAAIIAALQKAPATSVGLATLTELTAEAALGTSSAAVKAACTGMPLPVLPTLPKP